jgi:hypothetical protein
MSDFLKKHQRQPKIFIDLPSAGRIYDQSVLQDMQATQLPVFGMTAMDEIMLKTPDALFSGEATAHVIKSCVPSILNPWALIGFDIDYILIAIRIATYGDKMPIESSCTSCGESNTNEISLGKLLDSFSEYSITTTFTVDDLTVHVKPISYRENTGFNQEQYTLERTATQIDRSELSQEEKDKQVQTILEKMTNLTLRLSVSYIDKITDGTDEEADKSKILDFISNNDAKFYKELQAKVKEISDQWNLPTFDITCSAEDCGTHYKSKIGMDYSSFFGNSSYPSRNLMLSN